MKSIKTLKKIGIIVLLAAALFALAACGNKDKQNETAEPAETTEETEVTDEIPGEIEEEEPAVEVPEYTTPLIEDDFSQVYDKDGDPDDLADATGASFVLPDKFEVTRYAIVNDSIAQVEFVYDGEDYVGRYATGRHSNLSGMENLKKSSTATVNGIPVQLRYTPDDNSNGRSNGVADAYDQEKDITYCVIEMKKANEDNMIAAMEAFMDAIEAEQAAQ